ncbi:MAG TPA: hypothetical protein VI818_04220, partial [Candidatus Thermoplasmatota archaeon]|nr:hypothetical protein [Candidatus Thermoplasmatota archaeon]
MDKKTVGRVVGLILVTALLAASITTMYVGLARYDAMWFWSTVAGYVILLFLVLFIFRIRADEADAAVSASGRGPSSGTSGLLAAASLPDAPFEVQKATGMLPVERALEMGKPAGFVFRGFTLYERAVAGKMSRAFAKKVPAGATAITLPTGYEATWDPKKREPKLVRLVDEEAEVVIERGAGKPCSAWNSPGEICENVAVGGTQYCKKHANYRGGMEWGGVETRIARRDTKGGAFRSATPTMEVITAKPRAKPFTVKIPTVEVHLDRRLAKPVKFGRASEPEVRLARGKPMKPLRFGKPKVDVRVARLETPKPLRLGQPDV